MTRTPVLAFAIASAALAASAPAHADSCNDSTYIHGNGNTVVNNCTIEKRSTRDYDSDTDYEPAPPVYYPGPGYRPLPVVRPWFYRPGPAMYARPFFFAGGFRR
jgi:hypothetical protein